MRLIFFILFLLLGLMGNSQPKPKKSNQKMPSQKEINDLMKEAQEALNEMSPEQKRLMDSMGFKMPSAKTIPKVSEQQLANAWEDESRLVPKRDAARIAAIPGIVTDSKMKAYIIAVQTKVSSILTPAVINAGNEVYNYIKTKSTNADETGTMATGLWLAGQPELALYVLGKVCADDATHTDNLSNYSAMLSMNGAQHVAIPILNNLNARYPKNSTLLNNLGQAWFGLGEINKAEKYLDSAIRIYAYHPQANSTKSLIDESKGNTPKAVEAVKRSIKHSYTADKEDRLKKLGHQLTLTNIRLPFTPSTDPLGLNRFRQPDYPNSVSELKALKPLWDAFDNDCRTKIAQLEKEKTEAIQKFEQELKSSSTELLQAVQTKGSIPALIQISLYATRASLQLQELMSYNQAKLNETAERWVTSSIQLEELRKNRKKAPPEAPCQQHVKEQSDFLKKCNGVIKPVNDEFLKHFKQYINDMAYWSQYTSTSESQFEILKLGFMIEWLEKLQEYRPILTAEGYEFVSDCVEEVEPKPTKLAEFDDIACQYKSTMDLVVVKMETNCSHTTTTYNLNKIKFIERELGQNYIGGTLVLTPKISAGGKAGPLGVEIFAGGDISIELDKDNNVKDWKGTVSTGIEASAGIQTGPVKAGVSVTEAIEVEIGSKGVGDVNLVIKTEASLGVKAGTIGKSVEAGVQSKTSLVSSHGSVSGTGLLGKVSISKW